MSTPHAHTWTIDLSDTTARYLIRGYFDGSGQHFIRVWDRQDGRYLEPYFRSTAQAIDYMDATNPNR